MGAKFTQLLVKGPSQQELVNVLRFAGRNAVVGPTINGFTVIGDQACETFAPSPMQDLTGAITGACGCPGLGIHYFDDDVLSYMLYQDGEMVDEYDSCPDYHDFGFEHNPPRPPQGGDTEKLAGIFGLTEQQKEAAQEALHTDLELDMGDMPDLQSVLGNLSGGAAPDKTLAAMQQLQQFISGRMSEAMKGPQSEIEMDKAFPAQWRFERLLKALGAPEYAMHFSYGTEEEFHNLPAGSIVRVGSPT